MLCLAIAALLLALPSAAVAAGAGLPPAVDRIMDGPRYSGASWSLYAADVKSGRTLYSLHSNRLSLTGSTRKLFSVGVALDALGAHARQATVVHRRGHVDRRGRLRGDLVLVGGGDLAFGGRRIDADTIQYTDFDHNDANSLGTADLTPQSPLHALNALARRVRRSGIRRIDGNVAIDDRLFKPYRVPNGNLLITPVMLNENMVDVTVKPTKPGRRAKVHVRPRTGALRIAASVKTGAAGSRPSVTLSADARVSCVGAPGCTAAIGGSLPFGYKAPLTGGPAFVHTFRIEDPDAFMRTAFVEALRRADVAVHARAVGRNPRTLLPRRFAYRRTTRVAAYRSAPFAQTARLILKVSLNLGANLSLSLFGLEHGARTIKGSLAAERRVLTQRFGIDGRRFRFPTNGSGTPDSEASPRALVKMLRGMDRTRVAAAYTRALPLMGVNGSLAHTGTKLASRGKIRAKPGTTIMPSADGSSLELEAQNMAGYYRTPSGRRAAFALMVNDVGAIANIETDVAGVFEDEARILDALRSATP